MTEESNTPGLVARAAARTRRASKGFAKLWMYSTVGDVPAEIARRKQTASWLKGMIDRNRRSRVETFEDAMARLGIDNEALAGRLSQLERMSLVYMVVCIAGIAAMLLSPFVTNALSQFFMSVGVIVLCAAKAAVCRFRMHEIRERQLFGFADWLLGRI